MTQFHQLMHNLISVENVLSASKESRWSSHVAVSESCTMLSMMNNATRLVITCNAIGPSGMGMSGKNVHRTFRVYKQKIRMDRSVQRLGKIGATNRPNRSMRVTIGDNSQKTG